MLLPARIIAILWVLFFAYWMLEARRAKPAVHTPAWWQRFGIRAVIILAAVIAVREPRFHAWLQPPHPGAGLEALGIAVCVCGLAFAVWARLHLGRNWGQPMTLKEGHELVTTGPYSYVRHPIYSGILLAMAGSALVTGVLPLAALVLIGTYFVVSARTEEKIMGQQFPGQYPEYKRRTKALLPFVW